MIIDFSDTPGSGGIPFRSRLETEIAAELDTHDVEWGYGGGERWFVLCDICRRAAS